MMQKMDLSSTVGSETAVKVDGSSREKSNQTQFFYLTGIPLRVSVCQQNQMIWSGLYWQKGMKYGYFNQDCMHWIPQTTLLLKILGDVIYLLVTKITKSSKWYQTLVYLIDFWVATFFLLSFCSNRQDPWIPWSKHEGKCSCTLCWRLVHSHSSHGRIYLCISNCFFVLHQLFNVLQA